MEKNDIEINGIKYVRADSVKQTSTPAKSLKGMRYCIVRTYSAGVFAGYVPKFEGKETTVFQARRLWYWDGAASLSQLAMEGVKKPENCKFPCELDKIILTEAIEIIPCTEKAIKSIKEVKIWKM